MDPGNARLSLFTREGEWAGLWRWQPITGSVVRFHRPGIHELYARVFRGQESAYARFTHQGPGDTLVAPAAPDRLPGLVLCPHPDGAGFSYFEIPLTARQVSQPAPGRRLAVAVTDEYRIHFVDAEGDTVRMVERQAAPPELTDEDWSEATREYRNFRS